MSYSYTQSSSITNEHYIDETISTNDETYTQQYDATTVLQTSSVGTDGDLAAELSGEALAVADNTLAVADLYVILTDDGSTTQLNIEGTMLAVGLDSGGNDAYAATNLDVSVDGQANAYIGIFVNSGSTYQSPTTSVATASSSADVTAIEVYGAGPSSGASPGDPSPDSPGDGDATDVSVDGNLAFVDVGAAAVGEETFLLVDAYVFTADTLSDVNVLVDVGVG